MLARKEERFLYAGSPQATVTENHKANGDIGVPEKHQMILQGHVGSGAGDWFCLSCGRGIMKR